MSKNIRIPIHQISLVWEQIKHVASVTDNVQEQDFANYCRHLLIKLLTNKLVVVVKIDDENNLEAMAIFEYAESKLTGLKSLIWKNFYSWRGHAETEWTEAFETIKLFAKEEGCSFIDAISYSPRVWELAEEVKFKETSRQYILEV